MWSDTASGRKWSAVKTDHWLPAFVLLTGCGAPASLSVSVPVTFAEATTHCPETSVVRLTNDGQAPISLVAITKTSGDAVRALPFLDEAAPVFTLEGVPATIAPRSSADLTVRFGPNTSKGDFAATVKLEAASASVALSFSGRRLMADFDAPGPFDFGAIVPGATANLPFELSPSTSRLRYTNEVVEGPAFSRLGTDLVFRPSTVGRFTGVVRLDARDAPGCEPRAVRASLIGDAVSATLTTTPVVDFGFVPPGRSKTIDLPLENVAFTPAVTSGFTTAATTFSVDAPDGGSLLVPRGTRDAMTNALLPGGAFVRLRFSPTDAGTHLGALDFATDVAAQPQLRVSLRGVGGGAVAAVSPESVDFGTLTMSSTRALRLSNVGTRPLPPDPRAHLFLGLDGGLPYFELRHVSGATGTVSVTMTTPYNPAVGIAALTDVTFQVTALPGTSANDLHLYSTDLAQPDLVVPILVK